LQFVSWDEWAAEAPSRLAIPQEALASWPAERIFDLRWAATVVERGGALDFFIDDASIDELFPGKDYSRTKFTYQMSDHLPIWIHFKTDIDGFRLNQIVQDSRE
jgi:hypothetical protein